MDTEKLIQGKQQVKARAIPKGAFQPEGIQTTEPRVRTLEVPPLLARNELQRYFPGILNPGTLANLKAMGLGPRCYKVGRKAVYKTKDILEWLKTKGLSLD